MSQRIFQLLPSLAFGDAIGNEVASIRKALSGRGYDTHVYFLENPGGRMYPAEASPVAELPELDDDDIILYHLSIGSPMNQLLRRIRGRKIFRYHNITPAEFFRFYNVILGEKCREGLEEIRSLSDVPERCIAVSQFNKEHLRSLGYTCPIDVCPIVIDWQEYDEAFRLLGTTPVEIKRRTASEELRLMEMNGIAGSAMYRRENISRKIVLKAPVGELAGTSGLADAKTEQSGETNSGDPQRTSEDILKVLFVGRVAPNKKQQDLIAAVAAYAERYDRQIHLTLVGSAGGNEKFKRELCKYADMLGIGDLVFFCGHTKFAGIVKSYTEADVFLCMSEHEGFCVPLIEAMHFGVPILAYDSSAVGETLGDGGILLKDKNPEQVAEELHRLKNPSVRKQLSESGRRRVEYFSPDRSTDRLLELILK
ncbi:MAG: glycosyltransferase family 4 protein [Lachnospiraceae bacterium]|nr:glycosyltransferase family 4 protein [Lachnospiraceae bacterium]